MDNLDSYIESHLAGEPCAVDDFMALNGNCTFPEADEMNLIMNPNED